MDEAIEVPFVHPALRRGSILFPLVEDIRSDSNKDLAYQLTMLDFDDGRCTCKGFQHRQYCKHVTRKVEALKRQLAAEGLDMVALSRERVLERERLEAVARPTQSDIDALLDDL